MENRQDNMETAIASLAATVSRVETNQQHAEELNKLRFDSLGKSMDNIGGTLSQFIGRIEGIIDGTVETNQTRQAASVMSDYLRWRERVETHIDESEKVHLAAASRNDGVVFALTGGKAIILTIMAVVSPLIAIFVALTQNAPK